MCSLQLSEHPNKDHSSAEGQLIEKSGLKIDRLRQTEACPYFVVSKVHFMKNLMSGVSRNIISLVHQAH